ncbi:MAG: hypothetical protein B6I34_09995 [Anaerolineaceae bacterium 4572_32.1]|nr:MAG: hypothetical protein B6I34_09995 [Anaerolineaceae bacterium 4572_32.1]
MDSRFRTTEGQSRRVDSGQGRANYGGCLGTGRTVRGGLWQFETQHNDDWHWIAKMRARRRSGAGCIIHSRTFGFAQGLFLQQWKYLVRGGEFKFIYISCMNPAMTLPNQRAFREGVSRRDVFVALHETHWTKTTRYADLVLPAPTYLEKEDLVIPWGHNYVQYSPSALHPVTNSRSEVWVMREIAERLGLTEDWLYQDPWNAAEPALENAFEGGNFRSLRSGKMLTLKTKPHNNYPTISGKIEFYSSRAAELGLNPLPIQTRLCIKEGNFILLTSATSKFTSTQFQEVYGAIPALVTMNSRDAERLGITEGHIVTIANERGQVQMKVTISETLPKGVMWSPRQSEGLAGEPQNCLMSSNPQEIGSGPSFNSTMVTVTKH